jgi:hypothetical protein
MSKIRSVCHPFPFNTTINDYCQPDFCMKFWSFIIIGYLWLLLHFTYLMMNVDTYIILRSSVDFQHLFVKTEEVVIITYVIIRNICSV